MIDPRGAASRIHFPLARLRIEPLHPGGRKEGEQVHVLVAEHPAGARRLVHRAHRRIVVEPQPEVGAREPAVVEVRVAAQGTEQALHDRKNQPLVGLAHPAEERLAPGAGPEVFLAVRRIVVEVERTPAEHPALDQVGVDVAGLLDREVPLVDRAEAARAVAKLLLERGLGEQLEDPRVGLVVEGDVDAVSLEDCEAQAAQRIAQLAGERLLVGLISVEEPAEVAGRDAGLLVEGLGVVRLGEVVLLPLVDLVVPAERLVRRLDPLCLAVAHGEPSRAGADVTSPRGHGARAMEVTSRTRRPGAPVNRNLPRGRATAS